MEKITMKNKIIGVIGKTGSGKSTLYNNVINNKELCEKYNLKNIKIVTTKPLRNKVEEKEYVHIQQEEFNKLLKENKFVNYITFHTLYGNWSYAHLKENIDLTKYNYIMILDPKRALQTKKYFKDDIIIFNIFDDEELRIIRLLEREDNLTIAEKVRRLKSDKEDFSKYCAEFDWQYYYEDTNSIVDIENKILKILK